jgi:hypothetical protein
MRIQRRAAIGLVVELLMITALTRPGSSLPGGRAKANNKSPAKSQWAIQDSNLGPLPYQSMSVPLSDHKCPAFYRRFRVSRVASGAQWRRLVFRQGSAPPCRWKPKDRWTAQQHLDYAQHGTWPESDEYVALRREVLADAGLEDDASGDKKPVADMTTGDPLKHIEKER